MVLDEPLAYEVRKNFNHLGGVLAAQMRPYLGRYELFHAFHRDPSKAVVASLMIGEGSHAGHRLRRSDALLRYEYPTNTSLPGQAFTGKIIKHGRTATLLLSDEHKSKFIMYMDAWRNPAQHEVIKGVFVADLSSQGDRASAWPFYARRLIADEAWQPRVISWNDAPPEAQTEFERGAINWEPPRPRG